jgi:hypothetical protein
MTKLMKGFACALLATGTVLALGTGLAADARAAEVEVAIKKDATRACTLVLSAGADMDQWWQCVDAVGNQRPTNEALLKCAATIRWHSQPDGKTAGLMIAECFRSAPAGVTHESG